MFTLFILTNSQLFRTLLYGRKFKFDGSKIAKFQIVPFEWFRKDDMDTVDVKTKVLEKIFNQEEVLGVVLKEFKIDMYVKGHHVYKEI